MAATLSRSRSRLGAAAVACMSLCGLLAPPAAYAQNPPASKNISVELNKLEGNGSGCRAYIVADNPTDTAYSVLKLDLVLFRPDGVIDRRIALDLGPLPAKRKYVKSFDLEGLKCDGIGSVLLNGVLDCKADGKAVQDCLDRVEVSSRASAQLSK